MFDIKKYIFWVECDLHGSLKTQYLTLIKYLHVDLLFLFQAVRNLVAAVLKEKGPNGQITQSSTQVSYVSK